MAAVRASLHFPQPRPAAFPAAGAKFILGVNLHSEDPKLTKAQVKRILEVLPRESIMSIAVGNEPDM